MCDKSCECKGKQASKVRAFQVFYGTSATASPIYEGVRFSDGSGIYRSLPISEEIEDGEQSIQHNVKDFDVQAKYMGWRMDSPSAYGYNLKWTDAA